MVENVWRVWKPVISDKIKKESPVHTQDPQIVQYVLTVLTDVNIRGSQRLPNSLMPRVTEVVTR